MILSTLNPHLPLKRILITHRTEYFSSSPATFGPQRARPRPREGHEVPGGGSRPKIEPRAEVRRLRDISGNPIAVTTFAASSHTPSLFSEGNVAHYGGNPPDFLIDPNALPYLFQDVSGQVVPL